MPFTTPRLVATDLDGTIVREDGTLSLRTIDAFRRIETAGAAFVLATGRPPRLMESIAAAFGHRGTAICSNGVFVYDMAAKEVVATNAMAGATAAEAARRLRAAIPGIGLGVEFAHEVEADAVYVPHKWDEDVAVRRVSDAELFSRPVPKLIGRHLDYSADELVAMAEPVLDGLVYAYHSNGDRLIEAIAPDVNKGVGVANWAAGLGIDPADVVAFGDMPNDIPLLEWAGTSFAVAGAHPDAKAVAGHVIGALADDGVAEVLEQMFPAL